MNSTRRYPRTLEEAFGPYTSREIHTQPGPPTLAQRIGNGICWSIAVVLLLFFAAVYLKHGAGPL